MSRKIDFLQQSQVGMDNLTVSCLQESFAEKIYQHALSLFRCPILSDNKTPLSVF